MANNHMGSLAHAKKIVKDFKKITNKFSIKIDFAIKFQYRDKDSFIHKDFVNSDDRVIKRFKSTFLSNKDWKNLIKFSKKYFKLVLPLTKLLLTKSLKKI